jgi:hypothetical protein
VVNTGHSNEYSGIGPSRSGRHPKPAVPWLTVYFLFAATSDIQHQIKNGDPKAIVYHLSAGSGSFFLQTDIGLSSGRTNFKKKSRILV